MLKKKNLANLLFWTTAFFTILPFVVLSFFTHPGAEDYTQEYLNRHTGFWELQKLEYLSWSGRFFTNFIMALCSRLGLISRFYFLHTLILFALTILAAFLLLSTINKKLLNTRFSAGDMAKTSFVFLVLNIYLLADIAGNFYWYSASFVYQVPVVLLLLLGTLLLHRFQKGSTHKIVYDALIATTLILLTGCNETSAVVSIAILAFACLYAFRQQLDEKKTLLLYFSITLVSGAIIFATSGILMRQKLMNSHTASAVILPITGFRLFMVFYHIFKEPVFWIASAFCLAAGAQNSIQHSTGRLLSLLPSPEKIYRALVLLLLLVAAILTPLLMVSRGSFPDRALGNIIITAALYLLALSFMAGHLLPAPAIKSIVQKITPLTRTALICATMILSVCYVNAWQSVGTGFFYHAIMTDRDRQLTAAKRNREKSVTITPYPIALQQKMKTYFPGGTFKSLNSFFEATPVTIPFFNEAERTHVTAYYLKYYELDRIIIQPDKP